MATDDKLLLDKARAVREFAHAPYSGFRVGVALVDELGQVHVGCNVENASYPQGSCAEPNAIGAMIAAGGTKIVRLLVIGGREALEPCAPCGGCRQHISEFADNATRIVVLDDDEKFTELAIAELLPRAFSLE